jgi:hypothetical protein
VFPGYDRFASLQALPFKAGPKEAISEIVVFFARQDNRPGGFNWQRAIAAWKGKWINPQIQRNLQQPFIS